MGTSKEYGKLACPPTSLEMWKSIHNLISKEEYREKKADKDQCLVEIPEIIGNTTRSSMRKAVGKELLKKGILPKHTGNRRQPKKVVIETIKKVATWETLQKDMKPVLDSLSKKYPKVKKHKQTVRRQLDGVKALGTPTFCK